MSADINDLNLSEPDPTDWDTYDLPSGGTFTPLPPRGIYQLIPTEPPEFDATKPDANGKRFLKAKLGEMVVQAPGQPHDQYKIRFNDVNVKHWPGKNASSMGDYLLAHGYLGQPRSNEDYKQAVEGLVGHPCFALIDWEAYCGGKQGGCGARVKFQRSFPKDDEGKQQAFVNCPNGCTTTIDKDGVSQVVPKRLYANARVISFVPPPKP